MGVIDLVLARFVTRVTLTPKLLSTSTGLFPLSRLLLSLSRIGVPWALESFMMTLEGLRPVVVLERWFRVLKDLVSETLLL